MSVKTGKQLIRPNQNWLINFYSNEVEYAVSRSVHSLGKKNKIVHKDVVFLTVDLPYWPIGLTFLSNK